jgi:hypothetical protein
MALRLQSMETPAFAIAEFQVQLFHAPPRAFDALGDAVNGGKAAAHEGSVINWEIIHGPSGRQKRRGRRAGATDMMGECEKRIMK